MRGDGFQTLEQNVQRPWGRKELEALVGTIIKWVGMLAGEGSHKKGGQCWQESESAGSWR
jgi:hypothetical protein